MQRFVGSSISIRRNRFKETGSKFEPVSINYINIGKSFNSINSEQEFFTNYVNTPNQKIFIIIDDFYQKIANNINNLFKGYTFDELYYNGKAIDRLISLINKTNNSNYSLMDLPNIYKLKNDKEPKIHLYVQILNDSALILLIDLYHLSIPGDLYSNHRFIKRISLRDLPKIYTKYKEYDYNLNKILKTDEKELQSVS
ncbi:MAG: hypothetical protein J6D28_05370 [Bacilli bacterium]|nr:hypothetical protein [Bacilli bacterium]